MTVTMIFQDDNITHFVHLSLQHRLEPASPVPIIVPAKLSEIELILIICALLFLTLLLLGIGIAYYCLKRRNIKIRRKKKIPSPAPSEVTKLSSVFDQIRIPRAIAPSTESSTDYPSSESDERRTIVSETSTFRNDHFRYENTAFVPEPYPLDIEKEDSVASVPLPVAHKPNITTADFTETLVSTEYTREEDVIDSHHKRTTGCLYKKLPTTTVPPSIPDNDNWSQAETEDRLALAPYVKPAQLPRITSKTVEDTYVTNQLDTDVEDIVTRHRKVTAPPKIQVVKTDDIFVTNIEESEVTQDTMIDRRGIRGTSSQFVTQGQSMLHESVDLRQDLRAERSHRHHDHSMERYEDNLRRAIEYPSTRFTTQDTHQTRADHRTDYSTYEEQAISYGSHHQTMSHGYDAHSMIGSVIERERDDSFASVPVVVARKPSLMGSNFVETDYVDQSREELMRTQEVMMMGRSHGHSAYRQHDHRRPSMQDDVWSQAETEVRHALTVGRSGYLHSGVEVYDDTVWSQEPNFNSQQLLEYGPEYRSEYASSMQAVAETSVSHAVQRTSDKSYSFQKEFRRE